jgi:GT2 family glycosyltransferase
MSQVDVVIPVYGRPDMLKSCLEALKAQTFTSFAITVVDDASPKGLVSENIAELCKEYEARLFVNSANSGFPKTVNRGARKCDAPFMLLLNSDVMLRPNALEVLISEMAAPDVGIAAPMLLFAENSPMGPAGKIQHVGMAFNVTATPVHIFLGWSVDNPRAVRRRDDWPCVTGACFLTRRATWRKVGGFQEVYGRGTFEDVEFCLTVRKVLGHKIVVNPEAIGEHVVGASAIGQPGGKGYDLRGNFQVFITRMRQFVEHDDYHFW